MANLLLKPSIPVSNSEQSAAMKLDPGTSDALQRRTQRVRFLPAILFLALNTIASPGLFAKSGETPQLRSIASELSCKLVFDSKEPGQPVDAYAARLKQDPVAMVDVMVTSAATGKEVPVKMTRKMEDFRKMYLQYLKNPVYREPMILSFESQMRMRSDLLKRELIERSEASQFDVVIVGAGVHGIISAQTLLAEKPNLRVLIVEEGDTAGATFRGAKDTFNINSSNRASGRDTTPLPGEGNINELPFLPIQVSDLTAVKYPSANDLGSALVAGLYALVRQNPSVQVLFGASAKTIRDAGDPNFKEQLIVSSEGKELTFNSQAILISTGLGKPKFPAKLSEAFRSQPELVQFKRGKGLPKVVAFEDVVRIIAQSNDPMSLFKDKNIGVVGTGDSANVFIEFLLGYASAKAYGQSSAQSGLPNRIGWIGQSRQSCEEFIRDARSRYAQIGTGFRSSSDAKDPILDGIPAKLDDVFLERDGSVSVSSESGNIGSFDMLVLTTGFEPNVRGLLRDVTAQTSGVFESDADFFNESPTVKTIEGFTSTSGKKTKIGRQLRNREVYVIGTAAGQLAAEAELVGIIQNFVSIFNNAPRVVSISEKVGGSLKASAPNDGLAPVTIRPSANAGVIEIRGLEETRIPPSQSINTLEAIAREAASNIRIATRANDSIELRIQRAGENRIFVIAEKGTYDTQPLVSLLASSREFFNLASVILKSLSNKDLILRIGVKNGVGSPGESSVSVVDGGEISGLPVVAKVNNQSTLLRGLLSSAPRSAVGEKPVGRVQFTQENSRVRSLTYNRQTDLIVIEKFDKLYLNNAEGKGDSKVINSTYNFLTVINREGRQPLILEESKGTIYYGNIVGSPSINLRSEFGMDFIDRAVPNDAGNRLLVLGSDPRNAGTKVLLGQKNLDGQFDFKEVAKFRSNNFVSLSWINNGRQFIIAEGKTLKIFDENGSKAILQTELPGKIDQVAEVGSGQLAVRLFAPSSQPDVIILDLKTASKKPLNIGNRIGANVTMVGDPARGRVVFLPEDRIAQLSAVPVYDAKSGAVTELLVGETFPTNVYSGFFTKSGDLVVLDSATDVIFRARID